MIVHKIDNMASRFPDSLSKTEISEINKKAIPINTKKAMKFGLGVFQCKVIFLNISLSLNFTIEAEIVTLTRNNCQFSTLFTNFKMRNKIQRL